MLSEQLLGVLRSYWRLARSESFLFPRRDKDKPIHQTVLHAACRSARAAARIDKRVSVQRPAAQLRDAFARRAGSTFASSRCCSAMSICRRRRATRRPRRI